MCKVWVLHEYQIGGVNTLQRLWVEDSCEWSRIMCTRMPSLQLLRNNYAWNDVRTPCKQKNNSKPGPITATCLLITIKASKANHSTCSLHNSWKHQTTVYLGTNKDCTIGLIHLRQGPWGHSLFMVGCVSPVIFALYLFFLHRPRMAQHIGSRWFADDFRLWIGISYQSLPIDALFQPIPHHSMTTTRRQKLGVDISVSFIRSFRPWILRAHQWRLCQLKRNWWIIKQWHMYRAI